MGLQVHNSTPCCISHVLHNGRSILSLIEELALSCSALSVALYFADAICKGMRVMLQQPMARVPQLQRGSPRAASLMYPVNRLLILCNPDNHKQWCALYYFPATQDGSFGMYDKHLDLLQYCWASWYPDHLKDVHVDRF